MTDAFKYNFLVEYFDEPSATTKEYLLTLYVNKTGSANELSIFDNKNKRVFLKRGQYDQDTAVKLEHLYKGGSVTVCSRKFTVVEFGDTRTQALFETNAKQACTTVQGAAMAHLGTIMSVASQNGLIMKRIKMVRGVPGNGNNNRRVLLEMLGPDCVEVWSNLVQEIRPQLGWEEGDVIVSGMSPELEKEMDDKKNNTATYDNCSLLIVRPHAMEEGLAGDVVSALQQNGFEITAMMTYSLIKNQAENFYEVYKTVIPSANFRSMITELATGVCLAIEVCLPSSGGGRQNSVDTLRALCGPYDVEIARHLRPDTLRARLGKDNVHNAVHCTDLPEDGILESQYFFQILPTAC